MRPPGRPGRHGHGPLLQHGAGGVLGVGGRAQTQSGQILLAAFSGELHRPGGPSHKDGQHAGCHGIQRAAVPDPLFLKMPRTLAQTSMLVQSGGLSMIRMPLGMLISQFAILATSAPRSESGGWRPGWPPWPWRRPRCPPPWPPAAGVPPPPSRAHTGVAFSPADRCAPRAFALAPRGPAPGW